MKKNYISPDFLMVTLKTRSKLLNTSYSTDSAKSGATVFSREADFDDDDFE